MGYLEKQYSHGNGAKDQTLIAEPVQKQRVSTSCKVLGIVAAAAVYLAGFATALVVLPAVCDSSEVPAVWLSSAVTHQLRADRWTAKSFDQKEESIHPQEAARHGPSRPKSVFDLYNVTRAAAGRASSGRPADDPQQIMYFHVPVDYWTKNWEEQGRPENVTIGPFRTSIGYAGTGASLYATNNVTFPASTPGRSAAFVTLGSSLTAVSGLLLNAEFFTNEGFRQTATVPSLLWTNTSVRGIDGSRTVVTPQGDQATAFTQPVRAVQSNPYFAIFGSDYPELQGSCENAGTDPGIWCCARFGEGGELSAEELSVDCLQASRTLQGLALSFLYTRIDLYFDHM